MTATVAVVALPFMRFAYRAPAVHVVLETTNAIIAALVAFLVYGRLRENRRAQEALIVLGLVSAATANLALTAIPLAVTLGRDADASPWAGLTIRLIGTALLGAAAITPPSWMAGHRSTVLGVIALAGGVLLITALGTVWASRLPAAVEQPGPPGDARFPSLVSHPLVLSAQALGVVLYAVAALAFTRQAARTGDQLLRWIGAGCVLASAARVHYLLFPSLYSDYVYTGDVLRLVSYAFMLLGAAREIRSYWELRARNAVLEDRRRMARDLHDGLAQELAFISAQSQRLAAHPDDIALAQRIGAASGRAVDEARRAISALTRPVDEPFLQTLQRTADHMAGRYDVKVVADLDPAARVDPPRGEALLRIVSEAVRNAVRHGKASRIALRLTAEPLCLSVTDDGTGFDVAARPRGFGLTSMRERARGLGGELDIASSPGEGTTVRVTWR